jgi:hypothetical protein
MLQQGSIKEFIRDSPTEVIVVSLEHFELGAITEPWGDTATEFVVTEFKDSKGW